MGQLASHRRADRGVCWWVGKSFRGNGAGGSGDCAATLQVPLHRCRKTVGERRLSTESKATLRTRGIEAAPRLAIGLAGVPPYSSVITAKVRDGFDKIANRDFFRRPQIYWIGSILSLGRQYHAFGGVSSVEEAAR